MKLKEATIKIAELNSEIKMLRDIKNDLLYYNRVVLCRECEQYKKGYCEYWKVDTDKEGYCHHGARRKYVY